MSFEFIWAVDPIRGVKSYFPALADSRLAYILLLFACVELAFMPHTLCTDFFVI